MLLYTTKFKFSLLSGGAKEGLRFEILHEGFQTYAMLVDFMVATSKEV